MGTTTVQTHMLLSLNCARGEASTYAVLSFVTQHPRYSILLLQEPWFNSNMEPPPLRGFDMFTPSPSKPKCATYIRRSAGLRPTLALNEGDSFLGIRADTSPPFTIYNLYSPGRQQAVCHFFHNFQPDQNAVGRRRQGLGPPSHAVY